METGRGLFIRRVHSNTDHKVDLRPLDYIPEYLELLQHLRVNKLLIVHGFVDLQIYDMDLRQIVGLTGVA